VKANLSKIKKGTRLSKKFSLKGFRKKVIYYAQLFLVPFLEQIRYALSAYSEQGLWTADFHLMFSVHLFWLVNTSSVTEVDRILLVDNHPAKRFW